MRYLLITILLLLPAQIFSQLLAFPEAEGYGKYSAGGRFGKVIEVTNLNDSGTGSLRAAVTASGARIVVFRVSGTIFLKSALDISKDSIYIAGQTAPGDGICIANWTFTNSASNVIIRYLRVRTGDTTACVDDGFGGRGGNNVIIDHCSASWSIDETISFYENTNFTMQWCIASESLYKSHHPKGNHGYGGIWGGSKASFHHNLMANHSSRNPRFSGVGTTVGAYNIDFRNNVIFNWGFNSSYGGESGTFNMVGNYYKSGPATTSGTKYKILEPSDSVGRWFVDGNYVNGSATITANNWNGGVQGTYTSYAKAASPFAYEAINQQSPEVAYGKVLYTAGATLPKRDTVDTRIIDEVTTGVCHYEGTQYEIDHSTPNSSLKCGIIDSQKDVGGWPVLSSTTPPTDSDHDGMPDTWETAHGLNPNLATDRNTIAPSGYTYIEEYLNELGAFVTDVQNNEIQKPQGFSLSQNYPNPFNPTTRIAYSLDKTQQVSLKIFNLLGKEVATLVSEEKTAGHYEAIFNAAGLPSGIYFYQLKAGNQSQTKKLTLLK